MQYSTAFDDYHNTVNKTLEFIKINQKIRDETRYGIFFIKYPGKFIDITVG